MYTINDFAMLKPMKYYSSDDTSNKKYQDMIVKSLNKRYKKATEIEATNEVENLDIRLKTIENTLYFLRSIALRVIPSAETPHTMPNIVQPSAVLSFLKAQSAQGV